ASNKFSGAGAAVLDLAARVAEARGDLAAETRLLVSAAQRNPEDGSLVGRAEAKARALGDPTLLEAVLEAIPARERVRALMALADGAEQGGDLDQALDALGRARALEGLAPDVKTQVFERFSELYRKLGKHAELEELLGSELERDDIGKDDRARLGGQLAALVGARGDPERALEILGTALRERPGDAA